MAVVFAIYEIVDLMLLLAAKVVAERVKPIFHALGVGDNWERVSHRENAIERMCQLRESEMRLTKINAKGQVTIPADLCERFGIRNGTLIDWKRMGTGWC
jgi:AbrB family looped-hinge helix DNA binding protein